MELPVAEILRQYRERLDAVTYDLVVARAMIEQMSKPKQPEPLPPGVEPEAPPADPLPKKR